MSQKFPGQNWAKIFRNLVKILEKVLTKKVIKSVYLNLMFHIQRSL